ncbi:retron Ec78 anti-phage system effector ATPase PtuA [Alkalimonas collagenimarina]|uniref:Retron Ec78 anti-phage system effector ATPase PtuA n=1 Tax=Alkalimonas collagenimarina TaxID=400390 RepID=A0ABT9H0Z2_9GAMM|nr:retron Ec78 anti-phage system effector ATPase PtuA [Alkalimonas collagenimarina]MDP4536990.1 retron Ec78 anti-phage system effector ATPase PtuA [Alkalimonas collagenimarina]
MSRNKTIRQTEQHALKGDLMAIYQLAENYSEPKGSDDDKIKSQYYMDKCLDFLNKKDEEEKPENEFILRKIELIYFRKFESIKVDFDKKLNVIIGENGSGKTAIIESIAKVLSWICAGIETEGKNAKRIEYTDINVACPHYSDLNVEFTFGLNTKVKANLSRAKKGTEEKRDSNVSEIKSLANIFRVVNSHEEIDLPIFAYYSVSRASEKVNNTFDLEKFKDGKSKTRFDAYDGVLDGEGQFGKFIEWFLFLENIANSTKDLHYIEELKEDLKFIKKAVKSVSDDLKASFNEMIKTKEQYIRQAEASLTGGYTKLRKAVLTAITGTVTTVSEMKVDRSSGRAELKVNNNGLWININQLSQGQRVVLGTVADLALRMVMLNPKLIDPLKGRGIVLIDEIELHLHPKWQQQIILSLKKVFPNIQFILTTHSPHVLSTVNKESIRVLQDNGDGTVTASSPEFQTKGVVSSDILETLMNTFSIPPVEEAQWFEDFTNYVEQGYKDKPEALNLLEKLNRHYGPNHPVIKQCDSILRLQDLKERARSKIK